MTTETRQMRRARERAEAKRQAQSPRHLAQEQQFKDSDSMHQYSYDHSEKKTIFSKAEQPVTNVIVWGETDWIAIEWGTRQQQFMQDAFVMYCKSMGQSAAQAKDTLLAQVGEALNDPTTPPDLDETFLTQLGMYVSQCMTPNTAGFNHNYAMALCFRSPLGSKGYALRWLGTYEAAADEIAIAKALKIAVPVLGHKLAEEFAGSKGYKQLMSTLTDIGVMA